MVPIRGVTRPGHSPNRRCLNSKHCRRIVPPGGQYRLLERVDDEIEVTEPLCLPCARALAKMSKDEDAEVVLVEGD